MRDPLEKKSLHNIAQSEGPEFKPQYYGKK
jgi:hypothetical protein